MSSSLWLPVDAWAVVFKHLSLSDRLALRCTSKSFRDLLDTGALWRGWTLELVLWSIEDEHLWFMLRPWIVHSARLVTPLSLNHAARDLWHTNLTVNMCVCKMLESGASFSDLGRLDLTHNRELYMKDLSHVLPQSLTQLKVCQDGHKTLDRPAEIAPDFPFTKLKSLFFHCVSDLHPVNALHFFISNLPQLQHLSLKMDTSFTSPDELPSVFKGHISDFSPLHHSSLCSLELLDCSTYLFPKDLMKMLSKLRFLRSLAIFCDCNDVFFPDDSSEKVSSWLRDLPALTSLLVRCSDVREVVKNVPCGVTRLVVDTEVESWTESMSALSQRLPNLPHLHLQMVNGLGPDVALISRFFSRLKTLRLFCKGVPKDAFLSLASLKELEVLETLDCKAPPAKLVSKLQELSNYRVQIQHSPDLWRNEPCGCMTRVSTECWADSGRPRERCLHSL